MQASGFRGGTSPIVLGVDHVFFRPEVDLGSAGDFLWLSAPKPIVAPGTPFANDLQTWIRTDGPGALAPDWERIGTDVTHQGPFNAAFSLSGDIVPEPSTYVLLGGGLTLLAMLCPFPPQQSPKHLHVLMVDSTEPPRLRQINDGKAQM